MFKKNKYDIMIKDLKGSSKTLFMMFLKLNYLAKSAMKGKIGEEQLQEITTHLLRNVYPVLIVSAHIGYENCKDIKDVDKKELYNYLNAKGVSVNGFFDDYYAKQKLMCRMLAILSVLEKENIALPKLDDPKVAVNLLGGTNIEEVFGEVVEKVSDENRHFIKEALDNEFDSRKMSDALKEIIDNYHNSYMEEVIIPRVNKQVKNKQIIKNAEKLGRRI